MTPVVLTSAADRWPALPLTEWKDTYATLHMWTQVVGKVRMALAPPLNHFWHTALYVNTRGLTTGPVPAGSRCFEIQFDFRRDVLEIATSEGALRSLPLAPHSVAQFYGDLMGALRGLGIEVAVNPIPQEVPAPIPFDKDTTHASYDGEYARRFWRILLSTQAVLQKFRSGFVGKCSPVHFFWGSFDLCVTRFSGRRAPPRPGADFITREAYSHEVSSAGFWPGGSGVEGPAFYAYTVPAPAGLDKQKIRPAAASWNAQLGEFILMYDEVRAAPDPESTLMEFLQSTYEAGANLAGWNREELEVKRTAAA